MKHECVTGKLAEQKTDCLILGVFDDGKLPPATNQVDKASGSAIKQHLKHGDLTADRGSTVTLYSIDGVKAKRVLLVRCSKQKNFDNKAYQAALNTGFAALNKTDCKHAVLALPNAKGQKINWHIHRAIQSLADNQHVIAKPNSDKDSHSYALKQLDFYLTDSKQKTQAKKAMTQGEALAAGQTLCRVLAELPANLCTPTDMAEFARKVARPHDKLKVNVLGEAQMEKLGMGSLLSVSHGSVEEAKLVCLEYTGAAKSKKPIVLVGKGVTFDTGGLSLKPSGVMYGMKYDMGGAASVMGTMKAVAAAGLKINVVGILACVENMPSGTATKPGDVVKSMSGQTIEVTNTDAEGRLALCDALTYAQQTYKPQTIIDVATLTGAIIVALGHDLNAVYTDDDKLAKDLEKASITSGDHSWRMPIWAPYQKIMDSDYADMHNANLKNPGAGSITAACFLARFTEGQSWAHLDVAGTAFGGGRKGGTGRPVPMLFQYVLDKAGR